MSTAQLPLPRRNGLVPLAGPEPVRRGLLPAGWPIVVLLFGYGVTWLLGFGELIFIVLAVPAALALLRRRRIVVPTGFGLWLLFILWMLASGIMAPQDAPGTVHGNAMGHVFSWGMRALHYVSATIIFLYVGNAREDELRTRTLVRGLGAMFILTVAGGYLGMLRPRLEITTPLEILLPNVITRQFPNVFHPGVSEVQNILGYTVSRPSAPFAFTNEWGSILAICLPFFIAAWLTRTHPLRRRAVGLAVLAASLVPIVYSLNRGLWLALGVAVIYVAVRFAARGHVRLLFAVVAAMVLGLVMLEVSGLRQLVEDRLTHGHSNERRTTLATNALSGALNSPLLGWGTTRDAIGSSQSIAVGESAGCPNCGTPPTGTHGHPYLLTYSQGFVGVALYLGFLLYAFWHYRRNWTPVGLAGHCTLLMFLTFMPFYNLLAAAQVYMLIAMSVLWRLEQPDRDVRDPDAVPPAHLRAAVPALR